MARTDVIEQRISKLVSRFGRYVEAYDQRVSFTSEQLAAHRQTIVLRRQLGSVRAAATDDKFAASLRRTLLAWGIGRRASRLVPADQFAAALRAAVPRLEELEPLTIDGDDLPADIADRLWLLTNSLGVVENKAKLVAGAKTLHHLLPDLVPPIDREYTGAFFQLPARMAGPDRSAKDLQDRLQPVRRRGETRGAPAVRDRSGLANQPD
jgi:hypothetical protein